MDDVSVRAHTHRVFPPTWRRGLGSFRSYNESYEGWLKFAYSPSVEPFYLQPSSNYTMYATEYGAGIRQDFLDGLRHLVDNLTSLIRDPDVQEDFFGPWFKATIEQREEWLLQAWQREQEVLVGKHNHLPSRHECPELTLDFATRSTSTSSSWDRLNLWSSTLSTPPSRGVRQFGELAKLVRAYSLAQFCQMLALVIMDIPDGEPKVMESNVKLSAAERAELRSVAVDDGQTIEILDRQGQQRAPSMRLCSKCHKLDGEKGVKLTCCQRCKTAANRFVWYCGAACQREDWPRHKPECGKDVLEREEVAAKVAQTATTFNQIEYTRWLRRFPLALWGMMFHPKGVDGKPREKVRFLVPLTTFVRPYLPTLAAMEELRDRALTQHDDLDLGIFAYYIRLVGPRVMPGSPEDQAMLLRPLVLLLERDRADIEELGRRAETQIKRGEGLGRIDKLVLSALKQLESGKPDLSQPYQNLRNRALSLLNALHGYPDAFFFTLDPSSSVAAARDASDRLDITSHLVPMELPPDTPDHDRLLAALRKTVFDVLLTSANDLAQLGLLLMVVEAYTGKLNGKLDDAETKRLEQSYIMWGEALGFTLEVIDDAIELAHMEYAHEGMSRLKIVEEDGAKDDEELLWAAVKHFGEPPIKELFRYLRSGKWGNVIVNNPPPPTKKKKNKKKKKGAKKPDEAAAAEGEAAEPEE
ncbi:hypothetical protein JCM8097_006183 [Rhodosporidiobolus ruineniae]